MGKTEQPEYKVVTAEGDIEIRDYSPMIVAEVETSGERRDAIREGFKILADYIFGNNISKKHGGVTPSVSNQKNEEIPMTSPVLQQQESGSWKVRFVMPHQYSLDTLPTPCSKEITLIPHPSRHLVVIRFSGQPDDDTIKKHQDTLERYILTKNLKRIGGVLFAFYNPPWTLPSLRRNEIMIEINLDSASSTAEFRLKE